MADMITELGRRRSDGFSKMCQATVDATHTCEVPRISSPYRSLPRILAKLSRTEFKECFGAWGKTPGPGRQLVPRDDVRDIAICRCVQWRPACGNQPLWDCEDQRSPSGIPCPGEQELIAILAAGLVQSHVKWKQQRQNADEKCWAAHSVAVLTRTCLDDELAPGVRQHDAACRRKEAALLPAFSKRPNAPVSVVRAKQPSAGFERSPHVSVILRRI